MSEVLVDTSALIAYLVQSERHHVAARQFAKQHAHARWVVLETIFDETVTWLRANVSIRASIEIGGLLRTDYRYVHLSESDDDAAWGAFCRFDDKAWSYTDCTLLVMSQTLGIPEIFSFDEHIRQMSGLGVVSVP